MNHVSNLKTHGYSVINDFLDKRKIKDLKEALVSVIETVGDDTSGAPVGYQSIVKHDKMVNNIHYHSNDYLELAVNGSHIPIIQEFLNDPYYGIIPASEPNFTIAQCNMRQSSTAIPYHVDVRFKAPGPIGWSMQCIVALEDRHEFNGGLKVLPGSHLEEFQLRENLDLSNEKIVDLKAGDAVILFSHLYHATTDVVEPYQSAWGLLLTYRSWWAKSQFDFVSMFGEERLSKMSNKEKTLLGYYSQPSKAWDGQMSARQGYDLDNI